MMVLLAKSPSFSFLTGGDLFLIIWKEAPTVASTRLLASHLETFAASGHPEGVDLLVVVSPHAEMPDQATREKMAQDMKRHDSFTRRMALVFEGDGFKASVVRSIVAGINMIARQGAKTGVFANPTAAASWLRLDPRAAVEIRQVIENALVSG